MYLTSFVSSLDIHKNLCMCKRKFKISLKVTVLCITYFTILQYYCCLYIYGRNRFIQNTYGVYMSWSRSPGA